MAIIHFTDEQMAQCADALRKGNIGDLHSDLQEHLNECDECASNVALIAEISSDVTLDSQSANNTEGRALGFRISAAAIILILIGLGFYTGKPLKKEKGIAQTSIDTTLTDEAIANNNKLINSEAAVSADANPIITEANDSEQQDILKPKADNNELLAYATHTELENLVERFKTGAMRGDEVEIITPIEIEGATDQITLQWTNDASKELIVEFFNNKGEKLFEEITTASALPTNKLKNKGLYYWKLINEDFDLLYCGKIKIVD